MIGNNNKESLHYLMLLWIVSNNVVHALHGHAWLHLIVGVDDLKVIEVYIGVFPWPMGYFLDEGTGPIFK